MWGRVGWWGVVMALGVAASSPAAPEPRVYETRTWAQDRIIHSLAPEVAVSGGLYSGKTDPACIVAMLEAERNPGALILLCRAERASMTASTIASLKKLLPEGLRTWNAARGCGWKESESTVYWPRRGGKQSTIVCLGLDDAQRLQSINAHIVIIDQGEQITLEQFLFADGRSARQPEFENGRTIILFNPDYPEHWANQRWNFSLGNREIRDESGTLTAEVVVCDPDDVKQFASPRYLAKLDRYTGTWRARYRLNRWTGFAGSVFEVWNPNVHLIDLNDPGALAAHPALRAWARWGGYPPPSWPRYRGIDFGYYPDPFVLSWWAESPERRFYRYREIYHTKRLVEDHAKQAVELEAEELKSLRESATPEEAETLRAYLAELYIAGSWSDHDREDQETLNRRGIWSTNARKDDIVAGLQTVIGLLNPAQPGGARIFLIRGATVERDPALAEAEPRRPAAGEEEMGGYRWNKDTAGGTKRQLPIDRDNHFIDGGLRYVFHSMEEGAQVAVY